MTKINASVVRSLYYRVESLRDSLFDGTTIYEYENTRNSLILAESLLKAAEGIYKKTAKEILEDDERFDEICTALDYCDSLESELTYILVLPKYDNK